MSNAPYTVEYYSRAMNRVEVIEYQDRVEAERGYDKRRALPPAANLVLVQHVYYSDGDRFNIQLLP